MPDKPSLDYDSIDAYAVEAYRRLFHPDPAQPVAATSTYICSMPVPMFRKLFNQQDLPNGFSIEYTYGGSIVLLTYDPTADIPRHPEDDVPDSTK